MASNIEAGGNGACTDGTHVATPLQTASTPDTDAAREMGLVGARESRALGCNWAFTPIVDIHSNWRNTVIATRAFGNDRETVITYAQAYCDGVREGAGDRPMALCMKHFPGDGRDERDQHVVTSYNDCSVGEWDASYRKIWEWGIGAGIESIMVGHIMLPEYSRKLRPGIKDADILPATVSPELLTDLLRNDLGFNGVVLTDASLMVGLTSALPRERQMVQAITAGCDMILFFRNHDEDFGFVRDAVRSGEITPDRLNDALTRILGLKAKLGLHLRAKDDLVPAVDELDVIGCAEHRDLVAEILATGARVKFLRDGDVAGAILAADETSTVDACVGIGGTPEGVIAACALRCLDGLILGRLYPRDDTERNAALEQGYDLDRVLRTEDLVSGQDIFFAATGVTGGELLQGVRYSPRRIVTQSLSMRSKSGAVRIVEGRHHPERSNLIRAGST